MSWSIYNLIGTPDKITAALEKQATTLTGASKEEFDAVLPHIIAIVNENLSTANTPVLQVTANGHGSRDATGNWSHKQCSVEVKNLNGTLA